MSDKAFADRLSKKMNESFASYGYGAQLTPVKQAEWPSTGGEQQQPEQSELPSTTQQNVTSGETTPFGEPRADLNAQSGATSINQEAMGEISSLLISIGYILSKEGILTDKYDLKAVCAYVNDKFSTITPSTAVAPPKDQVATPEVNVVPDATVPTAADGTLTYDDMKPVMEARKMLESRFRTVKK